MGGIQDGARARGASPPAHAARRRFARTPHPPTPPPRDRLPAPQQKEAAAAAREELAAEKAASKARAEAAFQRWVVDKAVHDEALQLLPQLAAHGRNDDSWRNVGIAYAYCQVYLKEKHTQFDVDVSENPKRSFEATFGSWTRKSHAYDEVRRAPPRCVVASRRA